MNYRVDFVQLSQYDRGLLQLTVFLVQGQRALEKGQEAIVASAAAIWAREVHRGKQFYLSSN